MSRPTLDEIREFQITICLETGMFSLGDQEALIINGLMDYYQRNKQDISGKELARALRYVAERVEEDERH